MAETPTSLSLASCPRPTPPSPLPHATKATQATHSKPNVDTNANAKTDRVTLESAVRHLYQHAAASSSSSTSTSSSSSSSTDGEDEDAATKDLALTDATCVEFLDIMREFSASTCKVSEAVERVDSLMHQDQHLQRLLPIQCDTNTKAMDQAKDNEMEMEMEMEMGTSASDSGGDDSAMTDDEGSADADADETSEKEEDKLESETTGSTSDPEAEEGVDAEMEMEMDVEMDVALDLMDEERERQDLQRWMELELDLGGTLESLEDAVLPLPVAATPSSKKESEVETSSGKMKMTALEVDAAARRRGETEAEALGELELELPCELEADDGNADAVMWGMEVDPFERDVLTSLDHSVLCDRDNRFLQWDLEIEAAKAVSQSQLQQPKVVEMRTPPASARRPSFAAGVTKSRQKLIMEASPRENKMSHVARQVASGDAIGLGLGLTDDWNAIDFGSFQNRTVSHILSSCLHKRKLRHPYKDNVTLISFGVPGGEAIGTVPSGSMPGSILFGTDELDVGASGGIRPMPKDAKGTKSGERKAKKPRNEERKRQNAQKLRETLAELEGTFTEHDLDTRGMPKIKLENLPLPDVANLPQDLKELKRKIEATEHKVEGTKHRHRKGGPCPRCQVQNQLRAAKRAYHKRAVAHKKLPPLTSPTLGVVTPAPSPTSVASVLSAASLAGSMPAVSNAPVASAFALGVKLPTVNTHVQAVNGGVGAMPAVRTPSVMAVPSSAVMNPAAVPVKITPTSALVAPSSMKPTTVPSVAVPARVPVAVAVPASASAAIAVATAPVPTTMPTPTAMLATPMPIVQYSAQRLCGEIAVASAVCAATLSTAVAVSTQPAATLTAPSSTVTPAPAQVQQVTVTSA